MPEEQKNLPFTEEARKWLKSYWDESEPEIWQVVTDDPMRFVKEIANPFFKDLRHKGKEVPIFQFSADTDGQLLIKTSWETAT